MADASDALLRELSEVPMDEPWRRLTADEAAGRERELARELSRGHALHRKRACVVARRVDRDDVLFLVENGNAPLAVMHLTWQRESRPEWPAHLLFLSVQDWVERGMKRDADEWSAAGSG
jgi:hypothetical protein